MITRRNIIKFEEKLSDIDWDSLKSERAEETFDRFHAVFKGCFDSCFPLKTVNVNRNKKYVHRNASNVALKKAVDAALTIHSIRQSDDSKKLVELLKRSLRESHTAEKKKVNSEYISSSEDKTKAIWRVIGEETAESREKRKEEDDTSFVNDSSRRAELEIRGAKTLACAEKWFSVNGLKLNVDKSHRMIVAGNEAPQCIRLLGVTVDNRLTWNTHTTSLLKRLSTAIFTIRRMREVAGTDISRLTYFANFHQTATYGIILWGHSSGLIDVLLKQKEAIRAILGVPRIISCRELFRSLGILTVTSVYILNCIMYVHDNRAKFRRNDDNHHYGTRNRNELSIEYHRLKKTQTGTNHFGVKFYNRLPSKMRMLPRNRLLKKIKETLIKNTIYKFEEFWNIKFDE
ncbi:uncharacterized protein LOC123322632 [Coccinella septempunctata]|uniref:uncharacterized protein LOC123322632 n=1 Tax=Coccinella septempunctata TaxID=41139 RepID=UPI001D097050|nr:uncharacterized protein LOC123322632 [Coccinella septempunctata]